MSTDPKLNPMRRSYSYLRNGLWWRLLFLFLPVLAGCATFPTQTRTVVRTIDYEPVTELSNAVADDFELLGRVSVRNAQQRFSGSVRWHHTLLDDTVLLFSPFGQTVAEIRRNQSGVDFITSKQEVFHARDVEDLTVRMLGWRLPLDGLQYWVQGLHSPFSVASVDLDSEDQTIAIRQNGWEIFFIHDDDNNNEKTSTQSARPRVIQLQFEDLNIRMVVDSWIET